MIRNIAEELLYADVPLKEVKSKFLHDVADQYERMLLALNVDVDVEDEDDNSRKN